MPQNQPNIFDSGIPTPTPQTNLFDVAPTPTPNTGNIFDDVTGHTDVDTTIGGTIQRGITKVISSIPGAQKTISTIAPALEPVLDVIQRPLYSVARFADSWADNTKGPLDAVAQAFTELKGTEATPGSRLKLSFSDVIRRRYPDFAVNSPNATQIIGFIGDVAFDPLSWLGTGLIADGIKVGGKTLRKGTTEVIKEFLPKATKQIFVGADGTLELIEGLPKLTEKAAKVEAKATKFEALAKQSAVVDDTGDLIPLYHGTDQNFTTFKTKGDVSGVYFTTEPQVASIYAGENGRVIKAYSTAKNVLDTAELPEEKLIKLSERLGLPVPQDASTIDIVNGIRNKLSPSDPLEGQKLLVEQLKKSGYQGLRFMSDDGGTLHPQYLIFNNKDIKLAYTDKGVRALNKVTTRTGEIGALDYANKELNAVGYFDEVANRQQEITDYLNKLIKDPNKPFNTKTSEEIAKQEIVQDLTRPAKPNDVLYDSEVKQRLYDRMNQLVTQRPELVNQLYAPRGLYLKIGAPFGKQRDILKVFSLEPLYDKLHSLSTYIANSDALVPRSLALVADIFNKDFARPTEFINQRDKLLDELAYITHNVQIDSRKLFFKVNKQEQLERIGTSLYDADNQTRKLEAIRATSSEPGFRTLTDGEAAQIFQEAMDKAKLLPEERAVAVSIQQDFKEAALLETRAELLKSELLNYSARGYKLIDDAEEMSLITRGQRSQFPTPYLPSGKARKFDTIEEAQKAGFTPELNAAALYAHRMIQSQRALAFKKFQDSVIEMFGTYSAASKTQHTGILPTAVLEEGLPKRIVDDLRMFGDSMYPFGTNSTVREFLRLTDKLQGLWKKGATVARPNFAIKQLVANTFQSALVLGALAFKAFDPRAAIDASILLLRGGKPLDRLPPFLTNFITKHFTGNEGLDAVLASRTIFQRHFDDALSDNFLANFSKTDALGAKYSGTQLVDEAYKRGIIRGFDSTGETFSQKIQDAITRDAQSYKRVAGTLAKVWNHASFIEDYSRMMLFLNGVGMGYGFDESAKLVNKALFDYQRGLSIIEKSVIRRAIPFYCVPEDTEILTRSGWKRYFQLEDNEEVLTYNQELNKTEWQQVDEVATFEFDDYLTKMKNSDIEILCTENHRWVIQTMNTSRGFAFPYLSKPYILETNQLNSSDKILTCAEIIDSKESYLTKEQARLIGWLITDGYYRFKGEYCEGVIYQHPKKYLDEVILVAGGNPRKPHPDTGVICVPVLKERMNEIKQTLSFIIPAITNSSKEVLEVMYDAMYKADGTVSDNRTSDFLAAQKTSVREIFRILCVLLGKRTSENPRGIVIQKNKSIGVQNLKFSSYRYKGIIWCPKTKNGTWVMKQNDLITITGNTYNRFAIPFVLKQTLAQPGNLTTIEKLMRTTEKLLITGEDLNQSEVDTFNQKGNNYILEQPRLLAGFDKEGTASLNLMNNLTPYDTLNLLTYDKDGNIDMQRSAEKTFLAALTPYLKIPVNLMLPRDFFTGKTIQEVASKFEGNLDQSLGKALPQFVKDAMSWEVRKHELTGKTYTYINPYIAYYSMQFIPALREYIRPLQELDNKVDGHVWGPLNAAMKYVFPVNQKGVDLQEMNQYQILNKVEEINKINGALVTAKLRGDAIGKDTSFEFEDNLKKLQQYLQVLDLTQKERTQPIRGKGIGGNLLQAPQGTEIPTNPPIVAEPSFK